MLQRRMSCKTTVGYDLMQINSNHLFAEEIDNVERSSLSRVKLHYAVKRSE